MISSIKKNQDSFFEHVMLTTMVVKRIIIFFIYYFISLIPFVVDTYNFMANLTSLYCNKHLTVLVNVHVRPVL